MGDERGHMKDRQATQCLEGIEVCCFDGLDLVPVEVSKNRRMTRRIREEWEAYSQIVQTGERFERASRECS